MICSSRSPLATILALGKPSSSRMARARMLRYARSPESSRMPKSSWPCSRSQRPVCAARRVPSRLSKVSTSKMQLLGIASA